MTAGKGSHLPSMRSGSSICHKVQWPMGWCSLHQNHFDLAQRFAASKPSQHGQITIANLKAFGTVTPNLWTRECLIKHHDFRWNSSRSKKIQLQNVSFMMTISGCTSTWTVWSVWQGFFLACPRMYQMKIAIIYCHISPSPCFSSVKHQAVG